MKLAASTLLTVVLLQATRVPPDPRRFQYTRAVTIAAATLPPAQPEASTACAPLDATVYAHAQPALADLRLYTAPAGGQTELPYALTLSETATTADPARVLNLGTLGRHIVFDLAMPPRPYTHVDLDLAAEDFVINARVTGHPTANDPRQGAYLGTFTLFDLSAQNLARNATLPLSESTFPYLHVELDVISSGATQAEATPLDAAIVHGATIPPSREAQTLYTTVAATRAIAQRDHETIATLRVPAHVPIERVSFDLAPGPPVPGASASGPPAAGVQPSFSRSVAVRARTLGQADALTEQLAGEISRVKLTRHGQQLSLQNLSLLATVGSNAQSEAEVEIAIDNGDDTPLNLAAVRLEMRERRLCFDLPAATQALALRYGDPALRAPVYDFSRLFNPAAPTRTAYLQAERPNPLYQPTIPILPFTERHPAVLWAALLTVIVILGLVALRSARRL